MIRDYTALHRKIGPLRHQISEADCVPTTICNGLLMLLEKHLHPALLKLVWNLSISDDRQTNAVFCQALSNSLNAWFEHAEADYGAKAMPVAFESEIVRGEDVHLKQNNRVAQCLNAGGVACLSTKDESHYVLVHSAEGDSYVGFDPYWPYSQKKSRAKEDWGAYHGLANVRYDRNLLIDWFKDERSQWIHLIKPARSK